MIITKQWIHAHKTPAGGWNRKQIEALGLTWPARKGWQKRLEGTEIDGVAQMCFEVNSAAGKNRIEDLVKSSIPPRKDNGVIAGGVLSSHPQADSAIERASQRISELERIIEYMDTRVTVLERMLLTD